MITHQELIAASRRGVSATLPELDRDIDAQLRALADPDHPKRAVFLARGNDLGCRKLPAGLFVERRAEGTLVTDCANLAHHFRDLEFVTDAHLAEILGYPEVKADVLEAGDGYVVQALDRDGCVIFECAVTYRGLYSGMGAASEQVPADGRLEVTTIQSALSRRIAGMN